MIVETGNATEAAKVRKAGVAGRFYPGEAHKLAAEIDAMLAQAISPKVDGEIVATLAPHAGYPYSGPVAAETYAALVGRAYRRVVVIAPTHYDGFPFTSVYDGDAYETPLGLISVDREFAQRLAAMDPEIKLSDRGHDSAAAREEHAIEVQLPWLQRTLSEFKLVPIVMGGQDYASSRALGVALAALGGQHDTLILVSSDLSHYHPYDEAVRMDRKTLDAIAEWDYFSMARNFQQRIWEACGGAPLVAAMIAAERLGATRAEALPYKNSGDTSGDRSRVVGYGAALFVKGAAQADAAFDVSSEDRAALLKLARRSVESAVEHKKQFEPETPTSAALNQDRGAFVTLTEQGRLRGCIGFVSPSKALYLTVCDAAMMAALRDPRFRSVSADELPQLEYEISVLSPLRRVQDVEKIEVGSHGLLVKNGSSEGLLLPQVPVEQGWDRRTFLEQTCVKAGLKRDCWKEEQTDIFAFTAVVFGGKKR